MFAFLHIIRPKVLLIIAACITLVALVFFGRAKYLHHQVKKSYVIGIIISDDELSGEGMKILKEMVEQKLSIINRNNGIDGHPLRVVYLNDESNNEKLYELVQQSSKDSSLIGYVGCRGISRAQKIAPLLTERKIPLIARYSFTNYFKDYPTLYTASVGGKEAEVVLGQLFKDKAKRIGFIGETDNILSQAWLEAIENIVKNNPELSITTRRFFPKGHAFTKLKDKQLADSLKEKTDFIVFLSNPHAFNSFLDFMKKQNLEIPIYLGAPDYNLADATTKSFKNSEIYFFNTFGIPGSQNLRMMEQFSQYYQSKNPSNQISLELGISGRIADEIGLMHEAAQQKISNKNTPIREKTIDGLKEYINGNTFYRGWMGDWYFTPEHAYGGQPLLGWKPRGQTLMVLAPYQYSTADKSLQQNQVLFTNINIVEISQVSDDDGTFYATFYFEIYSPQEISLEDINFTNAVRNTISQEAFIETKLIRSQQDTVGYKFYSKLYQVSGKFLFMPDLKYYPLDYQKFPISIQATDPNDFFLVQPSQKQFRDTVFVSEGWLYHDQYMGYDQDIISSTDDFYAQKRNIPYYKFSYVYILKRTHIDFFLKTLVPLLAILVITYFCAYIPLSEFEALAGIQVTALLSSIALYFATHKPETQYATTSDKIFVFTYIMITTLIGTSILLYKLQHKTTIIKPIVRFYQRYIFPIVVISFTIYVRWF